MDIFQSVTDGKAILLNKGVYRQVDLYRRGANLYAKNGNGFIRLYPNQGTSVPSIVWRDLDPGEGHIAVKGCYLTYSDKPIKGTAPLRFAAE